MIETPIQSPVGARERRQNRFARMWAKMDESVDEQVRAAKEELFADLPSNLVEIGAGRGSSFRYYRPGTRVHALEPNRGFHEALDESATRHGIDLELDRGPLGPGSLTGGEHACVVSCLTMCSIGDIEGALAEIHRGLESGGSFVFIEHVAAEGGVHALYQRLIRSPWRAIGDGCDPRSPFLARLDQSPLVVERLTVERLGSNLDPTNLVAWGTARKN